VKQSTITEDGKNRTREEHVLRAGPDGQLAEVSRTVGKESQDASGEIEWHRRKISTDIPGSSSDAACTSCREKPQRLVTQPAAAAPRSNKWSKSIPATQRRPASHHSIHRLANSGASGTQQSRTLQVRGSSGAMNVVSVDMTKSDKTPAVQVQVAPAANRSSHRCSLPKSPPV